MRGWFLRRGGATFTQPCHPADQLARVSAQRETEMGLNVSAPATKNTRGLGYGMLVAFSRVPMTVLGQRGLWTRVCSVRFNGDVVSLACFLQRGRSTLTFTHQI